jgi:3,4-dihydroxy-2-butanone 4-phosphate synthase
MGAGDTLDLRQQRAAQNENLFREVNERIEDLATSAAFTQFVCECLDKTCDRRVSMTVEEYEHVRADGNQFFVLPGHNAEHIDEIIEANDRYLTVRKLGAGAEVAERLDPRSR